MIRQILSIATFVSVLGTTLSAFEIDTVNTAGGELKITCIGHGTLMFQHAGKVVHVDPVGRYADYSTLPKADLILVTHEHGDHFDPVTIHQISKPGTILVLTAACAKKVAGGTVMANGDERTFVGITVKAVPAYNIVHQRSPGNPFHPRGVGNGYIITFSDTRVYVAGDTENIPEMKQLRQIDIAFLPMNLPYTMTPEMVAEATGWFKPKILYPYHYGGSGATPTDPAKLVELLKGQPEIAVRIRKLQ